MIKLYLKMPKKVELSVEDRAAIVALYKNNVSVSEIAERYKCHRNTIRYQVLKEKAKGTVKNLLRKGRKRVTTTRDDRKILLICKQNSATTLRKIQNSFNNGQNNKVSLTTVHRRLKENNIKAYVVQNKPFISTKNKNLRMKFALEHISKPVEFWRSILWTDESAFSLDGNYGKDFYFSTPENRKKNEVNKPTRHSSGGKIMIWGCISYNGIGPIVRLPDKVTQAHYLEILNNVTLVAGDQLINSEFILQHDNAPIHKAKMIRNYLEDVGQKVLTWPSQSADLNVIENLWHCIKSKVPQQVGRTEDDTWDDIKRVWIEIPADVIKTLIDSVPRRLQEVIAAKRGNTSY